RLLQAAIAELAPRDAARLPDYLADNRRKLELFQPILERPFDRLRHLASGEMVRALRLMRPFSSVDKDLKRWFADPRIRLAFSFQTKYLG
ncbi:hypothetical protein OFC58_32215, partial [Escherichia coli]|nr:hypothetical protein [Escherichia coli]